MPAATMKVDLLTMTPDAEALVYSACKQCTSHDDAVDVFSLATNTDNTAYSDHTKMAQESLIRRVIDSGHTSVCECVQFSFAISGISRACSHQLVRHRVGTSFQQQSQRYVKADDFEYVVPKSILDRAIEDAPGVYYNAMRLAQAAYTLLLEAGVPAEDARFVLPNACATKLVVTMNARALLHFFEERCCQRAQWEIRALAKAMYDICLERLPVVFAGRGPKCKRLGFCTEHKSCGMMPKRGG